MLPAGGGVGMPDLRISRMNPKADAKFFDAVCEKLRRFNLPNLWFDVQLAVDGSHPTSGKWYNHYGLPLSAAPLRAEVQRLKALGLRPCTYTNQFIMPELLRSGGQPDKKWVAHDTAGQIDSWAVFSADSPVAEGDFFTKDLAGKLGTRLLTWAYGDYGRDAFRNWYVGQVTAAVDYYQPSGLSWDYGWSGMGPNQVCCRSNPRTTLAHGTFRAQAEIAAYLRRKYPQMTIIVNDAGGSPSEAAGQLRADGKHRQDVGRRLPGGQGPRRDDVEHGLFCRPRPAALDAANHARSGPGMQLRHAPSGSS